MTTADATKNNPVCFSATRLRDRAYYKSLNTLLKLRAAKCKARLDEAAFCQRAEDSKKIGFVSQEMQLSRAREQAERARQREVERARKQAAEKRREELHKWKVLLAEAEVDHRILQNLNRAPAVERRSRRALPPVSGLWTFSVWGGPPGLRPDRLVRLMPPIAAATTVLYGSM